jgi:hypothetical protein
MERLRKEEKRKLGATIDKLQKDLYDAQSGEVSRMGDGGGGGEAFD